MTIRNDNASAGGRGLLIQHDNGGAGTDRYALNIVTGYGISDIQSLYVDGNGNVGIGTDSPQQKLHIIGNDTKIQVQSDQNNWAALLLNSSNAGSTVAGWTIQTGPSISGGLRFYDIVAGSQRASFDNNGHFVPGTTDTYDLGSNSLQWRNIYTGDLHLSNEGHEKGNTVDGTTGNWTVQEGKEELYIINNNTGKKYKFMLKEIE